MRFLAISVIFLMSCGQFEGKKKNDSTDEAAAKPQKSVGMEATYYATDADVPVCDAAVTRALIYIAETKSFEYCDGSVWQIIDIAAPADEQKQLPPTITINQQAPTKVLLTINFHYGTAATLAIPIQTATYSMSVTDFESAVAANMSCIMAPVSNEIYECSYLPTNSNCTQAEDGTYTCLKPIITAKGESFQ